MTMGDVRCAMCDVMRRHAAVLALLALFLTSHIALPTSNMLYAQSDAAHQQFLFAYKLLQRGDDRLAADAFDDYLGRFPNAEKVGDAIYYLALLDRRAGRNEQAAQRLDDVPAPQLVPPYAVNLLRGQVLSDLKKYDEAVEALTTIDAAALEPGVRVSVLYLRGLARRGAADLAAAAADLEAAAQIDSPMKGRALLDLARVQVLMERPGEAVATLRRAMDAGDNAATAEAARMAGDLSYNQRKYDDAVGFYNRVLTGHPSSRHFGPSVIGTLWSHFSAGRYNQVLEAFERYRTALQVQDRVAAWYLAGSARQELDQHDQAVQLFDQIAHGEGRYPLQEKVLYKLAASQFELGRYDAMTQTIGRLSAQYPDSEVLIDAAFLLAAADARQGDVARGAARLTQVIAQGKDNPYYLQALLRRARLYETHGELKSAAQDYLNYLEDSTIPKIDRRQDGQPISQPTDTQAGAFLQLLGVYQKLGSHGYAAGLANKWLQTMRLPPLVEQEALYRRALSLIQLDQATDALATFDRLAQQHPINPFSDEAAYYRGLLLLSMDSPDQAVPLLQTAAAQESLPRALRVNALRLLALRQRNSGQNDAAAKTLSQLESLATRQQLTDEELLWMSRRSLERGDAETALGYAAPLVEGRPNAQAAARSEAIYLTGRAQRALGEVDAASRSFQQVVALGHGYDLEARLEQARVSADRGEYQQAMAELAGLISSESSPIAAGALHSGAMVQRQIARQHVRADNQTAADDANREAQRLLKRLVLLYAFPQLEPLPQLAYLELAEIAADLNQMEEAAGELRELISKYPDGPYATYARAVLAADNEKVGDAVALLKMLRNSTDYASLDPRLRSRVESLLKLLEPGS